MKTAMTSLILVFVVLVSLLGVVSIDAREAGGIHAAAFSGDVATAEKLLASTPAKVTEVEKDGGNTPLHVAAEAGQSKMVALLLAKGARLALLGGLEKWRVGFAGVFGGEAPEVSTTRLRWLLRRR